MDNEEGLLRQISVLPISTRSVREDVRISAPRCKGGLGYGEGFLEGFQKTRFQSYLVVKDVKEEILKVC